MGRLPDRSENGGQGGNCFAVFEGFEDGLAAQIHEEIRRYQALKAEETGDRITTLELWDWRYYSNQLKNANTTWIPSSFACSFLEQTLQGMFDIYQKMFGLRFMAMEPPVKWVDDLELYGVLDSETGGPGNVYLDMFLAKEVQPLHPIHFDCRKGSNGLYQRPCVALI